MSEKQTYPLILVFYLDSEMLKVKEIIQPFADSVNHMLLAKNANAMAFFLPTKGEERIECINPIIVKGVEMEKIYKTIADITEAFDVGGEIDVVDEEIILDELPDQKGTNE